MILPTFFTIPEIKDIKIYKRNEVRLMMKLGNWPLNREDNANMLIVKYFYIVKIFYTVLRCAYSFF